MSASAPVSTGSSSQHGFVWSLRVFFSNLFQILGFEPASKTSHGRYRKPVLRSSHSGGFFPSLPRDYIRRRRAVRPSPPPAPFVDSRACTRRGRCRYLAGRTTRRRPHDRRARAPRRRAVLHLRFAEYSRQRARPQRRTRFSTTGLSSSWGTTQPPIAYSLPATLNTARAWRGTSRLGPLVQRPVRAS